MNKLQLRRRFCAILMNVYKFGINLSICVFLIVFLLFKVMFLCDMIVKGLVKIFMLFKKVFKCLFYHNSLDLSQCMIQFNWTDPCLVGEMISFNVYFTQINGSRYTLKNTNDFVVKIESQHCQIKSNIEFMRLNEGAVVKFTVRTAGQYTISVKLYNKHIKYSPFKKSFKATKIDFRHCRIQTGGLNTLFAVHTIPYPVMIEAHDEYDNLIEEVSASDLDKFTCQIYDNDCNRYFTLSIDTVIISFDFDYQLKRIKFNLEFRMVGCYSVKILFENFGLRNSSFNIIVINHIVQMVMTLNGPKSQNSYDAFLLDKKHNSIEWNKLKKVTINISSKQLVVREYILKLFPIRTATFRITADLKFKFYPKNNKLDKKYDEFEISDSFQSIRLISSDRNMIIMSFNEFLKAHFGGAESFSEKRVFFSNELRKLHEKYSLDKIALLVDREKLIESSIVGLKKFYDNDWSKELEISFENEIGLDWGGLKREWFQLISKKLFEPDKNGLFIGFDDNPQSLVHPNPKKSSNVKLQYYEIAGKILGKCLLESSLSTSHIHINARFTRSFLAQLIGLRAHYKHFESDNPELYLGKIKYILDNDLDVDSNIEIYFIEEEVDTFGNIEIKELIPNGLKTRVTNDNKLKYLDALAQYKFTICVQNEINAFLKGLHTIVPDNLLSIFDENELELLLCGSQYYSITDLKKYHLINTSTDEFLKVVDWFWTIIENFTQEEMARLLQFTTGCSILPPDGFKGLHPFFQISSSLTTDTLPMAHTCFNQLCLPNYSSYELFEKSLKIALKEGNQGFGLV